jgi:hypothetical protein
MVPSHPIVCDDFLEYSVENNDTIHLILPDKQPEIVKTDKPLRRCTSLIPEFGMIFPMVNDVIRPTRSFSYLDILPPPTHVQYKNKMHKIRLNNDGRRYIVYDGVDILLRDIASMS